MTKIQKITSGSSAITILFKFGVTLFNIKNKSFSDIISGRLVTITDLIIARGIVLVMQFFMREFEKLLRIVTESSVAKVTSPRALTFSWIHIVCNFIIGSYVIPALYINSINYELIIPLMSLSVILESIPDIKILSCEDVALSIKKKQPA